MFDSFGEGSVHLAGIGGAAMSGLARMLVQGGRRVTGSDLYPSPATRDLEKSGIKIKYGQQSAEFDTDAVLIVRSPAVPDSNPEIAAARKMGLPVIKFPQVLGMMMRQKTGVAVSGAHGKTTCSSMTAVILKTAGLKPSWMIGGGVPDLGACANLDDGSHIVVEACEYDRSFLDLRPTIALVTNIDEDHLDYYKDIDEITQAFKDFVSLLPGDGLLVLGEESDYTGRLREATQADIETVTLNGSGDWNISETTFAPQWSKFNLSHHGVHIGCFQIHIPGIHNVRNAACAAAIAFRAGATIDAARDGLAGFHGAARRFQVMGKCRDDVCVINDYAHHPREISATLSAARQRFPDRRIWCIFQPHQHSRTRLLMDRFAKCFTGADKLVLAPIFAARDSEQDREEVSSKSLADAVEASGQTVRVARSLDEVVSVASNEVGKGDVIMVMGAGDIWRVAETLASVFGDSIVKAAG